MTINDISKIFFICLANNEQRINNVNNIIYNLNNFNVSVNDKIKINYVTPLNLYDDQYIVNDIGKYLADHKDNPVHTINSFSCFLNHYNIIGEAYFFKYDYIMVFEDDAYVNDFKYFNELLNNIPNDVDFIQFQYTQNEYKEFKNNNIIDNNINNKYFYKITNLHTWSNSCMILSKKLIKYIYDYYCDNKIIYADKYQYTSPVFLNDCNIYVPKKDVIDNHRFKSIITY